MSRSWLAGIAVVAVGAAIASAADPAIAELFRNAQEKVLKNVRNVPRYTCVQNISRTQYAPRTPGRQPSCQELIALRRRLGSPATISTRDRLRLAVAVVDGREMFSWAGADRFETDNLETLIPGGASSSGGFIGFMTSVFGGDAQTVTYVGLNDDQARFNFEVPAARSHYSYNSGTGTRITAYSGYFLLDPESAEMNRLVIDTAALAGAVPPACQVENEMDYQRIRIGSGDFLIPEVATLDVIYDNGLEASNETHYSDCHEFTGESTLSFDDLNISDPTAAAAKGLPPLPPKVRLEIALTKPIMGDTAAAGDPVTAVLTQDVRDKAHGIMAYKGDHVYGRIIQMEEHLLPGQIDYGGPRTTTIGRQSVRSGGGGDISPSHSWVVRFQFDTIEHAGVRQPVKLESLAPGGIFTFSVSAISSGAKKPVVDQSFRSDWETQ